MSKGIRTLAAATAALATPAAGLAQEIGDTSAIVITPELDRDDAAGARLERGVSPQPIEAGSFLLEPSLSLTSGYDTNVFNRDDNGDGDAVAVLTPRLRARTNTPRHLFQVDAVAHIRRFSEEQTENSEQFRFGARSRFDLAEENSLFTSGSYGREIETRSSAGTLVGAAEVVAYDLAQAQLGADLNFGALSLRPVANFSETDFQMLDLVGGGAADLSFRDTRTLGGSLALGYRVSGLVTAFGSAGYAEVESTDPAPNAARDADDWSMTAGLRGELTPLLTAEVSLGYRQRDFDLLRYRDYEGFTYAADLQWYVTPLVTIHFEADQRFLNSGNAQVAGILSNRFQVSGYYDPLRNLRLAAYAAYERRDFRETDTTAQRPSVRLAAQFFVNPNLSLGAFAGVTHQSVSGAAIVEPFTSFSTGIGVTVTP